MEEQKTYEIAGIRFTLKTDFELDESVEISNLLTSLNTEPGNGKSIDTFTITGKFTAEEMKRFLFLVLEPVPSTSSGTGDKNTSAESVCGRKISDPVCRSMVAEPVEAAFFGRTKESVQIEIFKDFFLDRIRKSSALVKDFEDLILQLQKS